MKKLIILEDGSINTYNVLYDKYNLNLFLEYLKSNYSYKDTITLFNVLIRNTYRCKKTKDYEVTNYKVLNCKNTHNRKFIDVLEERLYYPEIYKILSKNDFNVILSNLLFWIGNEEQYDINMREQYGYINTKYEELNSIGQARLMKKSKILNDYFNLFSFELEKSENIEDLLLNKLDTIDTIKKQIKIAENNVRILKRFGITLKINNQKAI